MGKHTMKDREIESLKEMIWDAVSDWQSETAEDNMIINIKITIDDGWVSNPQVIYNDLEEF